ncbi:CLUMA_CG018257, isoform A, partial [Clunio marinus]
MAKKKEKAVEVKTDNTRGLPKSGKFWKGPKEKFRKIQNTLPKKTTQQHLKLRDDLRKIKALSKSIKEEKKNENELKKQRREENAKRREENELKNQQVQIITNTSKLKRIKKKQLRQIQKRDLDNLKAKVV